MKKLSRDLGSPGSCQLLQLQLFFPNFFKFWSPPFYNFDAALNQLDPWIFGHALNLDDFLSWTLFIACLEICGSQILSLVLLVF